ncbi:MAG: carbamoyltransferase [Rhodothermaceae bacterium]|nr:carbamoyltransferase [Rhodothermaceae bacterium]
MTILGLSCWYHDAAACLVQDGRIVAAASEERFTRQKHDPNFPTNAVAYCLAEGGITAGDLDLVAFYDKPFLKFERLLESYLAYAPKGLPSFLKAMPLWLKKKLWIPDLIQKELGDAFEGTLLFPEHHESHAASAFFPSPFERAAILTVDGVGEWATTSWGVGTGNQLDLKAEIHFPHSLGLLYSAFTYFCGFKVNSGEYKLMGLAPYGEPRYVDTIREHLIDLKPDGSFRLHTKAFEYVAGLRMTGRRFEELFGGPAREAERPLTQREMDLARSVQAVTEEAMLRMAQHLHAETGETDLCLAGGVALNCVANGRILREGPYERLWIQPAAGDAGGAVGAALVAWHTYLGNERVPQAEDAMQGSYLGPAFTEAEIQAALTAGGLDAEYIGLDHLPERVAALLAQGQTVGWFQGRMEFGPRALGHRSILADARDPAVQRRVNLQIKFRESFRPFAPSVLREQTATYFGLAAESPYMLLVAPVQGAEIGGEGLERLAQIESAVPAVTHVDGSARVQTVGADRNPLYHRLLQAFEARTGCPVLVNTSFNVRGEPIVCTPADALRCFLNTHMDALALGPYLLLKDAIPGARAAVLSAEEVAAAYGLD